LFSNPHDKFCAGISTGINHKVMEALYENAGILSEFKKCPQTLVSLSVTLLKCCIKLCDSSHQGKVTLHNFFANPDLGTPFLGALILKKKWKGTLTVMDQEGKVLNQVDTYIRIRNKFSD
jgi:hypothetical protein